MKLPDIRRYAPLGFPLEHERNLFIFGSVCAALYSMLFFVRFFAQLDRILAAEEAGRLTEPAVMPDFAELISGCFVGFFILGVAMLTFILYHYTYHYQGSRAIYLMRRLPSRMELHRRCLSLPLIAVLGCVCAVLLLLMIYFGVYMLFTPRIYVTPDQWGNFWRSL